ncbi:LamG-like jellyroll fold domain-containing protein [Natranaeroarchaeum aerophilus]|uniref:Carboxypeptidase regulatory-like domain-containing protein n=1 Tax=Natranaeroarchaeum aerophilus TaxID=2917711 RepID=A0AAE3FRK6_9EURY|nr:LamG-like jellyroll fold domain-containing protein [Natranaeroarchaeum aerophilus]MCL9813558.1 carboxypeptidase regulatory-like domain-containing protein [Natranaeroarchaeum aerophilus]
MKSRVFMSLGLVFLLVAGVVLFGPTFGFSSFAADRGVSGDIADDQSEALLGLETIDESIDGRQDDATVARITNNFGQEITDLQTTISFASGDGDVRISDGFDDQLQAAESTELVMECDGGGGEGTAELTISVDQAVSAGISVQDASFTTQFSYTCTGGGGGGGPLPPGDPLVWETQADWADADEQDGVVHETFGDRQDDAIQLGYEGTDDGLVGYWPLDEETGTVAEDVSGAGNDGDHVDSPVIGADGLLETTSYQFDGESSHVEVPHDESLEMSDGDAVTVSTWVNQASDQSDENWVALVQKSDTSYNLQLANGNEPTFTIHDGDWNEANSGIEVETDRWYHLTGVYDGDEARIYVDGELEGATTVDGDMTDASEFDVGIGENLDDSDRHLDGRMDEVRLYDRALTETKVTALEDISTGSYTSGQRTAADPIDLETLELTGVDVLTNSGDASVRIEAFYDDGSTAISDPIELDAGIETYNVEGLVGEADSFRLVVEMETPDVERSPVLSRVELAGDSATDEIDPVRVNFQPPDGEFDGETPEGYLADVGEAFGEHDADVDYGWIDGPVEEYRERNSVENVRYDTLAHMNWDTAEEESWAVAVPDGSYDVTLVMGDPDHTDSDHTVAVEDTTFVDEEGEGGSNFVTHQGTVEVTGGQLRIDSADLGSNQKLAFVEVTPAADPGLIDDFEYPPSVLDDQYRVNYDGSPTDSHSTADDQLVLGDSSRLYSSPGLGGPEPYAERDLNYYPDPGDTITATTTLGQEDVVTTFGFGVDRDDPIRGYTVKLDPTSEEPDNDATVQLYSEDGDFENYPNLDDRDIDLDADTEYEIMVDWGANTIELRLFEVDGAELTDEPLRIDTVDEFDDYRGVAFQNRYLGDPADGKTVWGEASSDIGEGTEPNPAEFAIIAVEPDSGMTGETITSTVTVENIGDLGDTQTIGYELEAYSVAVVDEELVHGEDIAETLDGELPGEYDVETMRTEDILGQVDEYDVVVVQRFGSDGLADDLVDEIESTDTGAVYLGQWADREGIVDEPPESYSDGLLRLAAIREDVGGYAEVYTADPPVVVDVTEDHPVFEGIVDTGEPFTIHDGSTDDFADRVWIDQYSGTTVGSVRSADGETDGPTVLVEDERDEVLLGIGRSNFVSEDQYTDDADRLLGNAVSYVASPETVTQELELDGGESDTVEFEIELPDATGTYDHRGTSDDDERTDSIEVRDAIEGTVTDQLTGDGIDGATVSALDGGTVVEETQTDSDGSYALTVAPGTYEVTVEDENYETETVPDVEVATDDPAIVDVELVDDGWIEYVPDTATAFDFTEDGERATVGFDVTNTYTEDLLITDIEVRGTTADADWLEYETEDRDEVLLDATGDLAAEASTSGTFEVGDGTSGQVIELSYGTETPLDPDTDGRFNVGEFREQAGASDNTNPVDMEDEDITVVVYFEDDSGVERSAVLEFESVPSS